MTLNLSLVNFAFQKGQDKALTRQACAGADVVAVVEGIRRDGSPVDFPRLVPPGWTVHQNTANAGTAGSVLLTRDAACHAADVEWHHTSGPGVGLRRRFTLRGTLYDHAEARSGALFVTHVPPKRNVGARATHMKRLRALTMTPPSLVVGDFNMSPQEAADRLGMDGWGVEVMGLLTDRVTLTDTRTERTDHSDHPILRARVTFPKQKESAPVADYTVIRYGTDPNGRPIHMTRYMADWWKGVCDRLGFEPTIVQGAFMSEVAGGGASASAGYHDLGGCLDLRVWNLTEDQWRKVIRECRRSGAAAWRRDERHGMDPHIHLLLGSDAPIAYGARTQWGQYLAGRDGLASNGPDYHWRPDPLVIVPPAKVEPEPEPARPEPEPVVRGKHADAVEAQMKAARKAANKSDRAELAAKWRELLAELRTRFPKRP